MPRACGGPEHTLQEKRGRAGTFRGFSRSGKSRAPPRAPFRYVRMMSAINCRASFAGLAAALGLGVLPVLGVAQSRPEAEPVPFRVCADPNNLPFSDAAGAGFENKIAQLVAADLGQEVATTWWAQRRGFV